jgi:hypothetical protein
LVYGFLVLLLFNLLFELVFSPKSAQSYLWFSVDVTLKRELQKYNNAIKSVDSITNYCDNIVEFINSFLFCMSLPVAELKCAWILSNDRHQSSLKHPSRKLNSKMIFCSVNMSKTVALIFINTASYQLCVTAGLFQHFVSYGLNIFKLQNQQFTKFLVNSWKSFVFLVEN